MSKYISNNNTNHSITGSPSTYSPELYIYLNRNRLDMIDAVDINDISYSTDIWSIGIIFIQMMNAVTVFTMPKYFSPLSYNTDTLMFTQLFNIHKNGDDYFFQINNNPKFADIKEENKNIWHMTKLLVQRMIRLNFKKRITIDSVLKGIKMIEILYPRFKKKL